MNNRYRITEIAEAYIIATGYLKTSKSKHYTPKLVINQDSKPVVYMDKDDALAACDVFKEQFGEDLMVFESHSWIEAEQDEI